ncbi:hypothetical protein Bca4012_022721 [Brassica carinata]
MPLVAFITSEKPLLATISNNILRLSNHGKGSENLSGLSSVVCDEDLHSLFDGFASNHQDLGQTLLNNLGNHVVQSLTCLQNEASALAIESLKGSLMILAKVPYARFVVQKFFESCDDKTAFDSYNEIVLDDLVTNCVGHFVHQSVIRRLETLDIMLCRKLCSDIVGRKNELQDDKYGSQVFITSKNMLRKIGK